jgi:hypothetical protein
MGDIYEKQELIVVGADGVKHSLTLSSNVFEDIAPRVADMDGDGRGDVVVVETSVTLGASLAIYSLGEDGLFKLTATPHIGKVLRFWTVRDGKLVEMAAASGLTNHRIGDAFISGGVRDCAGADEIVTASGDWSRVFATKMVNGSLVFTDLGKYSAQAITDALTCD